MPEPMTVIPPEVLAVASKEEQEKYRLYLIDKAVKADEWQSLLPAIAPKVFPSPFADFHHIFWEWIWRIDADTRPDPFVGIWPRGGGKSSNAEAAVAVLGARGRRRYCLYIGETQDQADDHVANIGGLLESKEMAYAFPGVAVRMLGKYGAPKGWRHNRLRTASGFTVDSVGLDTAARGIKIEDMRPDLLVFDDIDSENDTEAMTKKKIRTITRKLIPAGSKNVATMAIQNKVHDNSIFAQLADGRADFLKNRRVSGPIPAIWNLEWEERNGLFVITGGTPAWPGGQGIETCQAQMNDWGLTAFLAEAQHSAEPPAGGMYDHIPWANIGRTEAEIPLMKRTTVWVDPAVTDKDQSDSQGIQLDGLGTDGKIYRLYSWEGRTSPLAAIRRALEKGIEYHCSVLGVETDQGGDTWQSVYEQACEQLRAEGKLTGSAPRFKQEKAGAGHGSKATRGQRMLVDYERDRFRHVLGTHQVLEASLRRFPKVKPFDLCDAAYWSWWELAGKYRGKTRSRTAAGQSIGQMAVSAN